MPVSPWRSRLITMREDPIHGSGSAVIVFS